MPEGVADRPDTTRCRDGRVECIVSRMTPDTRIYVAGHRGLAGSALVRALKAAASKTSSPARTGGRSARPERGRRAVRAEKPEVVFLAAAKVGGILANSTYPAEFIQDNLVDPDQRIHEAGAQASRDCCSSARRASIRASVRNRSTRNTC